MIIRGEPPTRFLTRSKHGFVVRYLSHNRVVIAKAPPRKRGPLPVGVLRNVTAWDQAQRMVKYPDPQEYIDSYNATSGTAFYARDQLIMAMYGHSIAFPGYGWRDKEMASIQQLLNSICTDPGAMLYRGPALWACVPLGTAGQLLTLDHDRLPGWSDPPAERGMLPLVNGDAYPPIGAVPAGDLAPGFMLSPDYQLIGVLL